MFTHAARSHKGREFVAHLGNGKLMVWQMVQNIQMCTRLFAKEPNPGVLVFEEEMPFEFSTPLILGQPVCIGSYGDILVFQYAHKAAVYVSFFTINLKTKQIITFPDSVMYFKRSIVMHEPLECQVSPYLDLMLFRLSQEVLTRRKWSKVLLARNIKTERDVNENASNSMMSISGTEESSLRDCRDQAITFHPYHQGVVVTALVDEFCSKCHLTMYNITEGKKILLEKKHRIITPAVHKDDIDGEMCDEEICSPSMTFLRTEKVSMAPCKSGEVLVLCVYAKDNTQPDYMGHFEDINHHFFIKLLQFDPSTLECLSSASLDGLMNPEVSLFNALFSACDSAVQLWDYNDASGRLKIIRMLSIPLKKSLNLKSLCRAKILQSVRMDLVYKLPLPSQILDYLNFK